ncbi:MAG: Ig-like domain-containing protein [Leptolyngbyaceae cyanobacterium SM2_5_2]|nr:Ig-like domain-containing protein [Leptolyngbyaceae cyanobacterium SM2_5_2]
MMAAVLTLVLGGLIFSGDHAMAKVREFSWQDRQVGVEDRAFLLTFSRPMDPASVEANLTIEPPLPGKVSWAGRRMAYTVTEPIPYGEAFTVKLAAARDRFSANADHAGRFEPFQGTFQTRQRAFLYIGAEGDEANRLVLADLEQQQRQILTPKNLAVLAFEPYPLGDRVLFSANDTNQGEDLLSQQLYTVTTGINPHPPEDLLGDRPPFWQRLWPKRAEPSSGELTLLLDNRDYQNLKFDLSADGKTIVVQRVNPNDPSDFGPWVIRDGDAPYRLETDPGGDFLIAPDSQSLVLLQGEGTAILNLMPDSQQGPQQPLDFLPNYGRVLDIAADGSAAAMVNFNQDDPAKRFTESLFLVTNQGTEEELLRVGGTIMDAQFDPTKRFLYLLASEPTAANPSDDPLSVEGRYAEQPFLLAVDLEARAALKLLQLPQQPRIHMSLAPDGRSLLLDLDGSNDALPNSDPASGPGLWYLPLFSEPGQTSPAVVNPELFPFKGIQATWLP